MTPKFKSKLEKSMWGELEKIKGTNMISYETQKIPYTLLRLYYPDFVIERPNGTVTYIEIKGYLRPGDRSKMAAIRRQWPDADIRFVFAQDNKISGSKMRYSDWARKYNFQYAIGKIPKKWMKA